MTVRIAKLAHSCVAVSAEGRTVLVDPGVFTPRKAIPRVDTVLVTHEHPDHCSPEVLAACNAEVVTNRAVVELLQAPHMPAFASVREVEAGASIRTLAGLVEAVGGTHVPVHDSLAAPPNLGFTWRAGDLTVYHPGDALHVPSDHVDVLFLPVCATLLLPGVALDFAVAIGARRVFGIHDRVYSNYALAFVDRFLEEQLAMRDQQYQRLNDLESATIK